MPHDITGDIDRKYTNWLGKEIEITHVQVTYYTPKDDYKRVEAVPIDKANQLANKPGVRGAYVSEMYDKDEALKRGYM
ncbi:hypothetical protein [Bacillus sp. FJAT-27251]|uniref:hypothetical protein n=1 Tax=Bacillus sp. FJAT-27251 TaxID=1684142 RepID=UPI0006A7C8F4|nr:hypothetical protein [Bacillus sp. FJAT-27251]